MSISFQKLFYSMAILFGFIAILVIARSILIPLAFAILFSFILFPIVKRIESLGVNRMIAAFISMFSLFAIIGGGMFFFSSQLIDLSNHYSAFQVKITNLLADVIAYINSFSPTAKPIDGNDLLNNIKFWLNNSATPLIGKTVNSTTAFIAQFVGMIIYTYLLLIDRDRLTNAFTHFAPKTQHERVVKMFKKIQQVGQKYLSGVLLIILILGVVNSVGLWIIGIDNPFLFGFLAASLSIVPYIGTTIGAIIPVLYAFMSHDSLWIPLAVAILFWSVQLIESNFLSPKIVGGSVSINALASILSLIVGASIWGIAGMILFLPFTAMLKVVCDEYVELKPIALLLGTNESSKKEVGVNNWRKKIQLIKKWFSKRNK
jgi:predicted PurR-regulated permease PerM